MRKDKRQGQTSAWTGMSHPTAPEPHGIFADAAPCNDGEYGRHNLTMYEAVYHRRRPQSIMGSLAINASPPGGQCQKDQQNTRGSWIIRPKRAKGFVFSLRVFPQSHETERQGCRACQLFSGRRYDLQWPTSALKGLGGWSLGRGAGSPAGRAGAAQCSMQNRGEGR